MKKMKKFAVLACALALLLAVAMLAGCNEPKDTTGTTEPTVTNTTYTISVRTAGGMLLDGVTVYVYEDATESDLADLPKKLDSEGKYSFTAPTSDTYTVVLQGVPEGYDVQEQYVLSSVETEIVLRSAVIPDMDATATTYELGSVIRDFTVTTVDGQTYSIAQILQEKEAVVLNFWYINCSPCKAEFPYLQAAYEKHSDKVEVLALNVSDSDADTAAFRDQYGLTFPVACVGQSLLNAMQSNFCPTTVIIDRYGVICYKYVNGVEDPAIFPALLRHFGAEDYVQGIVTDAESLVTEEDIPYGCKQYPYAVGAVEEFAGEVRGDELVYYTFYRLSDVTVRIEAPDVYMIWEGNTYYPTDGVLEMEFVTEDTFSSITVALGTTGGADKAVSILQVPHPGSTAAPYTLELGSFTFTGKNAFYTFNSQYDGTLTITVDSLPEGAIARFNITNLSTYEVVDATSNDYTDAETGVVTITMKVKAGDELRLIIGAYGENVDENTVIQALASIPEVEGGGIPPEDGDDPPEDDPVVPDPYTVRVLDQAGSPVANAELAVKINGKLTLVYTDENGLVSMELEDGAYPFTLTLPQGTFGTTRYIWTPANRNITITLQPVQTHSVQVSVANGTLPENITVKIYADSGLQDLICSGVLDGEGKMSFTYGDIDGCVAVLEGVTSNIGVESYYKLSNTTTKIVLMVTSPGDTDAASKSYHLGDKMTDFSVTAPDGTVYLLSELLQEKKAVVLTFWHTTSISCMSSFPIVQEAYKLYGTELEILALDPVDKSDAMLTMYQSLYGLTFPVAQCASSWETALRITAYPTMVIIDRDGTVCLIHSGSITNVDTLKTVFQYYTAEDYKTTVTESIDALIAQINAPKGTENDPIPVAPGTEQVEATLAAGQSLYYLLEETQPVAIRVEGGANLIYNGVTYESVDGVVELEIPEPDGLAKIAIGNAGEGELNVKFTITVLTVG